MQLRKINLHSISFKKSKSPHNNLLIILFKQYTTTISAMGYVQNDLSNSSRLKPYLNIVSLAKASLSRRETEVLILMCQENSTKQIAHLLNISPETVNTHKKALRKKTGSFTEVGVVIFAVKNKLFLFAVILSCYDGMISCCNDGIINC